MDRMLPLICLSSSKQQAGVENGPQTQAAANPTGNFADSDDTVSAPPSSLATHLKSGAQR